MSFLDDAIDDLLLTLLSETSSLFLFRWTPAEKWRTVQTTAHR